MQRRFIANHVGHTKTGHYYRQSIKDAAGVAVIRISGSDAYQIALKITKKSFQARYALHKFYDDSAALVDQGIIILPGPNSFTGEDVVELQVHGGIYIISSIVHTAIAYALSISKTRRVYRARIFKWQNRPCSS